MTSGGRLESDESGVWMGTGFRTEKQGGEKEGGCALTSGGRLESVESGVWMGGTPASCRTTSQCQGKFSRLSRRCSLITPSLHICAGFGVFGVQDLGSRV